jgi:hypothetical protein
MSINIPQKVKSTGEPEKREVPFTAGKKSNFLTKARSYAINLNLEDGNGLIWKISNITTPIKGEYRAVMISQKWDRFITPLKSSETSYTDFISLDEIPKEKALETSFIHLHDAVLKTIDCLKCLLSINSIANEEEPKNALIKKGNIPHPLYPARRLGHNDQLNMNEEDNLIEQLTKIFLISPEKIYNLWNPVALEDFEEILLKIQDKFIGQEFLVNEPPTLCTLDGIKLTTAQEVSASDLSIDDIRFYISYTTIKQLNTVPTLKEFQEEADRQVAKIRHFIEGRNISADFFFMDPDDWDQVAKQMYERLDRSIEGNLVMDGERLGKVTKYETYNKGKSYRRIVTYINTTTSIKLEINKNLPDHLTEKRTRKFLSYFSISDTTPNLQKLKQQLLEPPKYQENREHESAARTERKEESKRA